MIETCVDRKNYRDRIYKIETDSVEKQPRCADMTGLIPAGKIIGCIEESAGVPPCFMRMEVSF